MFLEIDRKQIPELRGRGLEAVFKDRLGLLIRDFWSPAQRESLITTVLANQDKWIEFPGDLNYWALGNALYGFRAMQNLDDYYVTQRQSDQMMAGLFPGLEAELSGAFQNVLRQPASVRKRKGFCGPGVIIQNETSQHFPHFDVNEGLNEVYRLFPHDAILFTMVGMLQKPPLGGRLFLWDRIFDPSKDYQEQAKVDAERPDHALDYPAGSLAILNGMKLHEIESSQGQRITVNCHFMRRADDSWSYWF